MPSEPQPLPDSESLPRRLDKYLRDATALSVDAGRQRFWAGDVRVVRAGLPGSRTLAIDDLIYADDEVWLGQERIVPRKAHHYIMLNKPLGVTSTLKDPHRQRDLTEYIRSMPAGVFPVGRLDRDTSGLLLCTNDGDFANAMLHPDHKLDKLYWLWLDEPLCDTDARLERLLSGVRVQDYLARASTVCVLARTPYATELLLTLQEGKNRQIRRMCRALDLHLHQLHRKAIGPVSVAGLPLGSFRELEQDEVLALWTASGGRHSSVRRKLDALERRARERRDRGAPDARLEAWLTRHARVGLACLEHHAPRAQDIHDLALADP